MSQHDFGEKETEYSAKLGEDIPVWVSPKFKSAREKAISIIDSGDYGIVDSDFWILMNQTKTNKMAYTGLIISHNGCLKINDKLADKFSPECVAHDTCGYGSSLVYTYCNNQQGIYEVGEVSKENCKNSYPYAMAYKRLFDRVVLKLSKLAYDNILSDSESDEFTQRYDEPPIPKAEEKKAPPKEQDKIHIDALIILAKRKGVSVEKITSGYKVEDIKDLTDEQYYQCTSGLKGKPDVRES